MNKNVKKVFIILLIVIVLLLICVKCYLSFVEVKNGSNLGIQNNPIREDQDEKKSKDNLKDNDKVLDEDDKQKEQEISNEEGIKDDTSEKVQNIKQENSKSDNKKKVKKNTGKPSTKETKNNIESDTSKKEENGKSQENTSQKEEKPKKEENSNVGNKKEDITSNQNNGTNSSESPFVTENDRLRKNIKAKYGVSVGYKDEIDDNYINSYEKQYDDQKINNILNTIDVALGKYPNSFFYEISNRWKSLTIYLVKNINSSMSGLTDNRNVNKVIILISTEGYLFENTLHPYSKALLSAIPTVDIHAEKKRIPLKGEIVSPIDPKPGCRFAARCPYATEECNKPQILEEVLPGHFVSCCKVREINNL